MHHALTGLGDTNRLSREGKESRHGTRSFRSVSQATGTVPDTQSAQ